MTNLNQYGAGCRCLLRLRENEGQPGMSDAAFLAQYQSRFPEWQERPGLTDLSALLELAKEMRLAGSVGISRDYDRVLHEHRDDRSILVLTERVPEQTRTGPAHSPFTLLLVEASDEAFTLWCPYPSGLSDVLPAAARTWWDEWLAIGIILHPPG
jgi:hypothetical protein